MDDDFNFDFGDLDDDINFDFGDLNDDINFDFGDLDDDLDTFLSLDLNELNDDPVIFNIWLKFALIRTANLAVEF